MGEAYRAQDTRLEREVAMFLNDACAGDDALRSEMESLLSYESDAEPFMEAPAVDVAALARTSQSRWSGARSDSSACARCWVPVA